MQLMGEVPPFPIPECDAGAVHPGFVAQPHHILQRYDRQVGHRPESEPDEIPGDIAAIGANVGLHLLALDLITRLKPANRGLIVVRTSVNDAIRA